MKKYTVSYCVRGHYDVEVEAENESQAEEKAERFFEEAEFTNLIDPQGEIYDTWES